MQHDGGATQLSGPANHLNGSSDRLVVAGICDSGTQKFVFASFQNIRIYRRTISKGLASKVLPT